MGTGHGQRLQRLERLSAPMTHREPTLGELPLPEDHPVWADFALVLDPATDVGDRADAARRAYQVLKAAGQVPVLPDPEPEGGVRQVLSVDEKPLE